jgi:hypothetical protein
MLCGVSANNCAWRAGTVVKSSSFPASQEYNCQLRRHKSPIPLPTWLPSVFSICCCCAARFSLLAVNSGFPQSWRAVSFHVTALASTTHPCLWLGSGKAIYLWWLRQLPTSTELWLLLLLGVGTLINETSGKSWTSIPAATLENSSPNSISVRTRP